MIMNNCEINSWYADNKMYRRELYICLSDLEWNQLEKQYFFRELIEYLNNRGIPESNEVKILREHLQGKKK